MAPRAPRPHLLAVVLLLGGAWHLGTIWCRGETASYTIPNPFKAIEQQQTGSSADGSYYLIRGALSGMERSKLAMADIVEYFSLREGLTFSLHKPVVGNANASKDQAGAWALLSDGPNGRSYIVRNYALTEDDDDGELECELDHVHQHHRRAWPWQYEYELPARAADDGDPQLLDLMPETEASGGRKRRRRNRARRTRDDGRPLRVALYGMGAIWLNAIRANATTDQVGDNSPYQELNAWSLSEGQQQVELTFLKLAADEQQHQQHQHDDDHHQDLQARLDQQSKLSTISVAWSHDVFHSHEDNSTAAVTGHQIRKYFVTDFVAQLVPSEVENLKRMQELLGYCRRANKRHHLFPNLMHLLGSVSPQKLYHLQYITRKYPLLKETHGTRLAEGGFAGEYDESRHRYVFPVEFVNELFSFKAETQIVSYDPLPISASGPGYDRHDVYVKKFTENENQQRSSRHSTVHYHLVEDPAGKLVACRVGEMERPPRDEIFVRPIRFVRSRDVELSAHLTGLGALLLNAASIHYKTFTLFRKSIEVTRNPLDLDEVTKLKVDEWQVDDKRTGWRLHFYFEQVNRTAARMDGSLELRNSRADLSRLVRVDVRDPRVVDEASAADDGGKTPTNDEYNLVVRFDIVGVQFELDQDEYERLFQPIPGEMCSGAETAANDSDDDDDDEYDSYNDYYHNSDDHYNDYQSEEEEEADDGSHGSTGGHPNELEQWEAEEFELGELSEDHPFPGFFEFLEGQSSYEILTRLEILDSDHTKYIWLEEIVDLDDEVTTLNIYNEMHSGATGAAAANLLESYYINYNSEIVFRMSRSNKCSLLEDVSSSWLRLFSRELVYHTSTSSGHAAAGNVILESNRLRLYGLGALWQRASDSEYSDFLGKRKKLVEGADGTKFRELVWALEESSMRMLFNFHANVTATSGGGGVGDQSRGHRNAPMHLDSVEILNLFNDYDQLEAFKSIRAKVVSVQGRQPTANFVPSACSDQLIEAMRLKEDRVLDSSLPKFTDLVREDTGFYELTYAIIGKQIQTNDTDQQQDPFSMFDDRSYITESYDQAANRARIRVDNQEQPELSRDIYIETPLGGMFAHAPRTGQCKRISELRSLVELGPSITAAEHSSDLGASKTRYGLAAMWDRLVELGTRFTLRIQSHVQITGHRLETWTYSAELGGESLPGEQNINKLKRKVTFYFINSYRFERTPDTQQVDSRSLGRSREHNMRLELMKITIEPGAPENELALRQMGSFRRTLIRISSINSMRYGWELPDSCKRLLAGGEPLPDYSVPADTNHQGGANNEVGEFPRLSSLLATLQQFHIKSEVSIKRPTNSSGASRNSDGDRFYLLDEWTHGSNKLRMKSRGLGRHKTESFDFIVYPETREAFDISAQFKCLSGLPPTPLVDKPDKSPNFVDFWSDETTIIERLAQLYYGPLALWKLAEKNLANLQLANSIDIAANKLPLVSSSELERHQDLEMRTNIWRVSSPTGRNPEWAYEMRFVKHARVDRSTGQLQEWHTLERIDLVDQGSLRVTIDIVDYHYESSLSEAVAANYQLPEGWGCTRGASHPTWDEFLVSHNAEAQERLSYEARLELIDSSGDHTAATDVTATNRVRPLDDSRRLVSPTLSGDFWLGGKLDDEHELNITVQESRLRFPNGTMVSSKTVIDGSNEVLYHIDRLTGYCSISLVSNPYWLLEFPFEADGGGGGGERVEIFMDDELIQKLFLDTHRSEFHFIGEETTSDGWLETRYEKHFNYLKLGSLEGPARVVRRYRHQTHSAASFEYDQASGLVKMIHDQVAVRVYLFENNHQMDKLRAVLEVTMRLQLPKLADYLHQTNVFQCYNDGELEWNKQLGSFSIEYGLSGPEFFMVPAQADNFIGLFYIKLVAKANLMPLQLDGRARLEVDPRGDRMLIHFSVLDAPPPHVYFKEIVQSNFNDILEPRTEMRLVPSLEHCSRWCERSPGQCLAMSYCATDHSCRILTEGAVKRKQSLRQQIPEPFKKGQCSYFYRQSPTAAVTLRRFRELLVEEVESSLKKRRADSIFALPLNEANPRRFTDGSNKFRWLYEEQSSLGDLDDLADAEGQQDANNKAYGTLRRWSSLDANKLADLNAKLGTNYASFIISDGKRAGCLEACETDGCLMFAHCARKQLCTTISMPGEDAALDHQLGDHLVAFHDLLLKQDSYDCSVMVRDSLVKYTRFANTLAPSRYVRKYERLNEFECALACQATEACRSFDFCSPTSPAGGADEETTSYCLHQETHVSLSTFNTSLFLSPIDDGATISNDFEGRQVVCDHYSKRIVEDFTRIPKARVPKRLQVAIKGQNVESCALDCQQADDCRAFEFCHDDRHHPAQSCYLIVGADVGPPALDEATVSGGDDGPVVQGSNEPQLKLDKSRVCSVYVAKRFLLASKLNQTYHSGSLIGRVLGRPAAASYSTWCAAVFAFVGYLGGALVAGILVQILAVRLAARFAARSNNRSRSS